MMNGWYFIAIMIVSGLLGLNLNVQGFHGQAAASWACTLVAGLGLLNMVTPRD